MPSFFTMTGSTTTFYIPFSSNYDLLIPTGSLNFEQTTHLNGVFTVENANVNFYNQSILQTVVMNASGVITFFSTQNVISDLSLTGSTPTLYLSAQNSIAPILNITNSFNWNPSGSSYVQTYTSPVGILNIACTATATFISNSMLYLGVSLNNYGTLIYSSSNSYHICMYSSWTSAIVNQPNGVWYVNSSSTNPMYISDCAGVSTITNYGEMFVSNHNYFQVTVNFNNVGFLVVSNGSLSLASGTTTHNGILNKIFNS